MNSYHTIVHYLIKTNPDDFTKTSDNAQELPDIISTYWAEAYKGRAVLATIGDFATRIVSHMPYVEKIKRTPGGTTLFDVPAWNAQGQDAEVPVPDNWRSKLELVVTNFLIQRDPSYIGVASIGNQSLWATENGIVVKGNNITKLAMQMPNLVFLRELNGMSYFSVPGWDEKARKH